MELQVGVALVVVVAGLSSPVNDVDLLVVWGISFGGEDFGPEMKGS